MQTSFRRAEQPAGRDAQTPGRGREDWSGSRGDAEAGAFGQMSLDLVEISRKVERDTRALKEFKRLQQEHRAILEARDEILRDFRQLQADVGDAAEILELKDAEIEQLGGELETRKKRLGGLGARQTALREELEMERCDRERILHDSERRVDELQREALACKEKIERRFQKAELLQAEYGARFRQLEQEKEKNRGLKAAVFGLEEEVSELRSMFLAGKKRDEYSRQESAFARYELDTNLRLLEQTSSDFDKAVGKLKQLEACCDQLLKDNYRLMADHSAEDSQSLHSHP
jgi:chromosome segregation ATPase